MKGWERTLYCGDVRAAHAGRIVTLNGWVDRRRDLGGLIFVHLRDREGIVQVVFNPERFAAAHACAEGMRSEFVVAVRGEVCQRPAGMVNTDLPTGEVEVVAQEAMIFNEAKTPVFAIEDSTDVLNASSSATASEVSMSRRFPQGPRASEQTAHPASA